MRCDDRYEMTARESRHTFSAQLLSGASHIDTLCSACNEILDSRRNACVQHKPYCLHKQVRHSEPFLSRNGENPPEIQAPGCQPRDTLAADLSKNSSLRPALIILSPQHTEPHIC